MSRTASKQIEHLPAAAGVYLLYHRKSQKKYVGASENIRSRASTHLSELRSGKPKIACIARWAKRLSLRGFRFKVLELCDDLDWLRPLEACWMSAISNRNTIINNCRPLLFGGGRYFRERRRERINQKLGRTERIQSPDPRRV